MFSQVPGTTSTWQRRRLDELQQPPKHSDRPRASRRRVGFSGPARAGWRSRLRVLDLSSTTPSARQFCAFRRPILAAGPPRLIRRWYRTTTEIECSWGKQLDTPRPVRPSRYSAFHFTLLSRQIMRVVFLAVSRPAGNPPPGLTHWPTM